MRIHVLTRKHLLRMIICLICLGAGLIIAVTATGALTASGGSRQIPIYSVNRDDNLISISFDAAWGNEDTQQLIDILAKYDIKATFFVVGAWVDKYPESVKALHDAGHEIMNHSNTHAHMPKLSRDKMAEEVRVCADKIEAVTGVRPFLFRPPYGDYDNASIEATFAEGHYTIQWDVDSLDWKDYTADKITSIVVPKVTSGSIVLFHNAAKHTPEALPGIIESLLAKGYKFVKISELIYRDNYEIDHAGVQQPKNRIEQPGTPTTNQAFAQ